jgi:ribonucleoside-diphosphate reductase subunit M2
MLDTYVTDPEEKASLFNAIETIPAVKKKADWAIKWIEDDVSDFQTRLICFAIIEGIFFSGSFCAIYWLKGRGIMPGLGFSNELISRDEGLHCTHACLLYSHIKKRLPYEKVKAIFEEAVAIETEFITEALDCNLIGMNRGLMTEYIKFVSNRLIVQLGYPPLYEGARNPFPFMESISIENKSNFFETRTAEYTKAFVANADKEEEGNGHKMVLTDDF